MKKCRYCAEDIQDKAIVCRYCNHDLPKPPSEMPISPRRNKISLWVVILIILSSIGLIIVSLLVILPGWIEKPMDCAFIPETHCVSIGDEKWKVIGVISNVCPREIKAVEFLARIYDSYGGNMLGSVKGTYTGVIEPYQDVEFQSQGMTASSDLTRTTYVDVTYCDAVIINAIYP